MLTTEVPKRKPLKKTFASSLGLEKLKRFHSAPTSTTLSSNLESSTTSLPRLQYSPLDPTKKSVRLLEIIPGPEYEKLKAKIIVCDLDDKPLYIALSYTWDKDGVEKYVEIDGTSFIVGASLWNFLQQYRKRDFIKTCCEKEPQKSVPLWIDAICIDQSNIPERNHQVSLMRDVYTGAQSVIVWLGLAQKNEELAFLLARYPDLRVMEEFYTALADVLNKPYWGRVWVVQEFVLAQSVDIWCGDFSVDASTVEAIWRNGLTSTPIASPTSLIYTSRGYLLFKYRRDFKHTKHYRREILGRRNSRTVKATFRLRDLLQAFASSQSSESFDKIYGFLGVASQGRGERIQPDYHKAPEELLVDVLRNQFHGGDAQSSDKDDYQFLAFLMQALNVSREKLAQHILSLAPEAQPHVYVLAATPCVNPCVSFISTITQVGELLDYDEAFHPSTWKSTWSRSKMHPPGLSSQDIHELGTHVLSEQKDVVLSFADPHVPSGNPGPTEKIRRQMIEVSADLVISSLVQAPVEKNRAANNNITNGSKVVRDIFTRSMTLDAAAMYQDHRSRLSRRNTDQRHARYTSFVGTNGITGLACGGGPGSYEIGPGDRICIFSGITDSNNAFITRLDPSSGKWLISGFAVILLPEATKSTGSEDAELCFHCHLTDLLELQRCELLGPVQMGVLLEQTLREEAEGNIHRCGKGTGECHVLEFGL
ncbi:heterokaryon incompatibility -domain-containing [Pyrenophora seminiperda CCB06]|uniref:Heterokaryon incompatibility-domain-containing n=1 Tax=Pyrenophora seminiperda CCB06 TaxID=1302712 RepID=A0A3M7MIT0_9PLEO|nr:heterokaryon incompatibility -domain-containing [Pyrenophora seminiperda CCB06]